MRVNIVIASLIGLSAAGPCKPKPTITSLAPAVASSSTPTSVPTSVVSTGLASSVPTSSAISSSTSTSTSPLSSVPSTAGISSSASSSSSSVSSTSVSSTSPVTSATTSFLPSTTSPTSSVVSTTNDPATASVTNAVALTYYQSNLEDGTTGVNPASQYTCFAGASTNFPAMSQWISFENMFSLLTSMAFSPIDDSADEIQDLRTAVIEVSTVAKVDPRVIVAVLTDESTGNVRVPCTTSFGGVHNCGLMQAYNSSSFDANNPAASIKQMIVDGTQGTQYGPGLVQLLDGAPLSSGTTGGDLWKALRAYNSGSFDDLNLSDGRGATDAYCSNIANFLLGWQGFGEGPADCDFSNPVNTSAST